MPLSFLCPNGHRITCADDAAGRSARCPKCAAVFRIPAAGETAATPVTAKAVAGNVEAPTMAAAGQGAPDLSKTEELFVFLCPNGHRLNASASMQGKAGQCPHCGAKFVVPSQADIPDDEELGLADTDHVPNNQSRMQGIATSARTDDDDPLPMEEEMSSGIGKRYYSSNSHPLCALVTKLWEEKQHGGVIELHLEGGTMLVPDWFDEGLSRQSHGLFAAQSADGTVTMTIVPWDKVARVVVRNVEGLPDGMFESS